MSTKIKLLFFLKKPKTKNLKQSPIYLRITIDGQRAELCSGREINPEHWNQKASKAIGKSEDIRELNIYLDSLRSKAYEAQRNLIDNNKLVCALALKNILTGQGERIHSLVEIFTDHNNKIEALLGAEFAPGTLERYKTSLKHTVDFIKWKFKVSDIDIRNINHAFITEYEFYLRSERKCNNNTAVKYIKNFGKIIRICLANGWLDKNPFANYKAKVKEVERMFLSKEELDAVAKKVFSTKRLSQIRDIFLFSCYTGLVTTNSISTRLPGSQAQ